MNISANNKSMQTIHELLITIKFVDLFKFAKNWSVNFSACVDKLKTTGSLYMQTLISTRYLSIFYFVHFQVAAVTGMAATEATEATVEIMDMEDMEDMEAAMAVAMEADSGHFKSFRIHH